MVQNLKLQLSGGLPGEVGVVATEVAARGGLLVDGAAEVEVAGEDTGAQVEVLQDNGEDLRVGAGASAVGVDVDREGLGHTDGVGDLDQGAGSEAGSDDGLGDPAGSVGARAVDLGGVLAGEGTTSVGSPASVGINDDLASCETTISHGSTNGEAA